MNDFDFLRLDGHILRTFLVILEENSVSRAADRLDLTQSAVSHTLAKLRKTLGDPLFVRSGQGLTPTETALSLKGPVQEVLDGMKALTDLRSFDPKSENMHFVVAANDLQRDLIFPDLFKSARDEGIRLSFEFKPSGLPSVSMLRDARCDLIITPAPPDAPDMIRQKLFAGKWKCFYDSRSRPPPNTTEEYLKSEHVSAQFALGGFSDDILKSVDLPNKPIPTVTVSNFAGITPFVLGTKMLTTQIEQMHIVSLRALDMAPLPFQTEDVAVSLVWHERSTNDPAHKWLRNLITQSCREKGLR